MSGFFDLREKIMQPPRPQPPAAGTVVPLSVSAVTKLIDKAIRGQTPASVVVRGEVSQFSRHQSSGHAYFTLKDADASLACVMFKDAMDRVRFTPAVGTELLATGGLRVYAQQGKYNLYVQELHPLGQGALELAFKQLRAKLAGEGLFAAGRKRPLPAYPRRIVIVTSRQTAALQDVLKVLRRYPWLHLIVCHVPVQGEGCGPTIAKALAGVNRVATKLGGVDLILLGRGGGSPEDLWGFNDESLARAIAASAVPVVTGIGHEIDTSIADLVADHHAHTPTEAARVAAAGWEAVPGRLADLSRRLGHHAQSSVRSAAYRLAAVERHELFRRPTDRLDDLRVRLDDRERSLAQAHRDYLAGRADRLRRLSDRLQRQTPAAQLARHVERLQRMQQRLSVAVRALVRRREAAVAALDTRLAARHPRHAVALLDGRLKEAQRRLSAGMRDAVRDRATAVADLDARLAARHPRHALALLDARLTMAADRLTRAVAQDVSRRRDRVDAVAAHLEAVSPQRIFERGFAVTRLQRTGAIVRSAGELVSGDEIVTRFHDGEVASVVTGAFG